MCIDLTCDVSDNMCELILKIIIISQNAALLGSFLVSTTAYTISMGLLTDYTQEGDLYQLMKKDMKDYKYYNKTRYTIFTVVDTLQNKVNLHNDLSANSHIDFFYN